MDFKVAYKKRLSLSANDVELNGRWTVVSPKEMEEITKNKWGWFNSVKNRTYQRTKLHLVYDKNVGRTAIAKTICYTPKDIDNEAAILKRRSILTEQIDLLNEIASPLLPEPLDWFTVTNTVDGLPEKYRESEPVLILDYQPGVELRYAINKKNFRFPKEEDRDKVDTPRVARLALKILYFLKTLKEHGYAYLDLNLEHILLLKDDIPRFVGLGRICKTINGHLDPQNINFGMTSMGYAAPELNDPTNNWKGAREATPEQIGAFLLGVVLHQMVYENTEFDDAMLKNGSFSYPNGISEEKILKAKNGQLIHNLICELCECDSGKRLKDFDKIEERLHKIAGSVDVIMDRINKQKNRGKKRERKIGWVKWYDSQRGFGFLVSADNLQEYHVSKTNLEKGGIHHLTENMRVKFDVVDGENGAYAVNIERLSEPQRQRPTGTNTSRPRRRPTPKDDYTRNKPPSKSGWCFLSTAAYGTSTAPKLDTLRWFRDEVLRTNGIGRKMLSTYIKISPKISHLLRGMPVRKAIVRKIIDLSVLAVEKIQNQEHNSVAYWGWTMLSVMLYYIAFAAAYLFVLPEKILGIKTTDSRGEDE